MGTAPVYQAKIACGLAATCTDACLKYYSAESASRIRRSRRFWPVGPVTRVAFCAASHVDESKLASARRDDSRLDVADASWMVRSSATAPAALLLPSIPSEPAERSAICVS